MAKTIEELIEDVKNANDEYHDSLTRLVRSTGLDMAQRVKVGSDALKIFELMTTLNTYITKLV